jgi:hypothetical protein
LITIVYYVPISPKAHITESNINDIISKMERAYQVEWIVELIKPVDADKYMLVGEKLDGSGTLSPSIGVKVIELSQDKAKTEEMINNTFKEMELDGDKNFLSISHPSEFVYIILYENKAGDFPRVKIIPNPTDPLAGSQNATFFFQALDEDEEWNGLQPFDSFMLDKESMIVLFDEN